MGEGDPLAAGVGVPDSDPDPVPDVIVGADVGGAGALSIFFP